MVQVVVPYYGSYADSQLKQISLCYMKGHDCGSVERDWDTPFSTRRITKHGKMDLEERSTQIPHLARPDSEMLDRLLLSAGAKPIVCQWAFALRSWLLQVNDEKSM